MQSFSESLPITGYPIPADCAVTSSYHPSSVDVTTETQREFLRALAQWCECTETDLGIIVGACPGHSSLISDPLWIRRLDFIRQRVVVQLQVEEMTWGRPINWAQR